MFSFPRLKSPRSLPHTSAPITAPIPATVIHVPGPEDELPGTRTSRESGEQYPCFCNPTQFVVGFGIGFVALD